MAACWWVGNSQNTAQIDTLTVTAVAAAGTLSATINGKSITYVCTASDTVATAAAAWQALLANAAIAPAEFNQQSYANPSSGVITATAIVPGTPFTMTTSSAGGATLTQTHTQANVSQSDVGSNANWLRAGTPGIPQNGDDVIVADSAIPLLWNLTALAAVQFNSYTRYQSFTGTIGLPEQNPLGYLEYRPTYFQFTASGTLPIILGQASPGSGPTRERYDAQTTHIVLTLLASGSPQDDYAVRLLNVNAASDLFVTTSSLGLAMSPGEVSTVNAIAADGGATVDIGPGVTITASLVYNGASGSLASVPGTTLLAANGGAVTLAGSGLTWASVTAEDSSAITWPINATITALTLARSSILDKSGDTRNVSPYNSTVTNSAIDGTCFVNDPNNCIVWTNATTVNGSMTSGPFVTGPNRTVKIT